MSDTIPIWKRRGVVLTAFWVLLIGAMLAGTSFYKPGEEPADVGSGSSDIVSDPVAFAQENWATTVVPSITDNAVELTDLLPALQADAAAAGEEFGHRSGESPYSFPVTFVGTVAEGAFGEAAIQVAGLDPAVTVGVQTGPAITGTAVRDAVGTISFEMFKNQIDFAKVGTELNNQVKAEVLAKTDFDALLGSTVKVVGAFSYDDPTHIKVTPISIEASNG